MFSNFVESNFSFLVEKTSDLPSLLNLLMQHGIISGAQREEVDEDARTNTKKATNLWNILKKQDDDEVPTIIKCLRLTKCAKSVPDCLQTYQQQVAGTANRTVVTKQSFHDDGDFIVTLEQAPIIAKCLYLGINKASWETIKNSWLSQEMLNDIAPQPSMKLDVQKSIESWIKKTPKPKRLYSKIVDAVREESLLAAEKLEEEREEVKAAK